MDNEQEHVQHIRLDDQVKIASNSLDEKRLEQTTDEDIIQDDTEPIILEQSQVNQTKFNYFEIIVSNCIANFLFEHRIQDVANLLNSQNALAAAAAAAAAVAANSTSTERLTPEMQDARLKLSSAAVAHINGTSEYLYRSKSSTQNKSI